MLSPSGLSVVSEDGNEDYDDDQPKAYVDDGEEERKEQEQGQGSFGKDEGTWRACLLGLALPPAVV